MTTTGTSSSLSSLIIYHNELLEWIKTLDSKTESKTTSSSTLTSPSSNKTLSTVDYGEINKVLSKRINDYETYISTALAESIEKDHKDNTENTENQAPSTNSTKDDDIDMLNSITNNTSSKDNISSTPNTKASTLPSGSSGTINGTLNENNNIEILPLETLPIFYSSSSVAVSSSSSSSLSSSTSTTTSPLNTSPSLLQEFYHDLLVLVLQGTLSTYHFIGILNSVTLTNTKYIASTSLLVDVLWMISIEIEMIHSLYPVNNVTKKEESTSTTTTNPPSTTAANTSDDTIQDNKKLGSIIRLLCDRNIISRNLVLERLELDTIEYSGYGRLDINRGKLIKTNTRLLYTQLKYNMLAEESEGYSKLLELLLEPLPYTNYTNEVDKLCIRLQSLCGQFSLDPNRIFDIVLDAYEMRTRKRTNNNYTVLLTSSSSSSNSSSLYSQRGYTGLDHSIINIPEPAFLSLLDGKLFSRNNLVQLLGFKFSQYAKSKDELVDTNEINSNNGTTNTNTSTTATTPAPNTTATDKKDTTAKAGSTSTASTTTSAATPAATTDPSIIRKPSTPTSLYTLAAWLIINGCINLRELWIHLGPTPIICKSIVDAISQALKDESKPATLGGLGGGSSASSSLAASTTLGDDYSSSRPSDSTASTSSTFVPVIGNTPSAASGTADPWTHPAAVISNEAERIHQKVGIIAGLLRCGSWSWACQATSLVLYESETGQLADLSIPLPIESQLEAWYKRYDMNDNNSNHVQPNHSSVSIPVSSADLKRILTPSATSGAMFDICSFPSIARAGCLLTRAAVNLANVLPNHSVRAKLTAAVGCPPGANAVTYWSRQNKSNSQVLSPTALLDATINDIQENAIQINSQGTCPFLIPAKTIAQLPAILSPLLEFLGPAISCDNTLLSDIFRVCKDIASAENEYRNLSSTTLTVQSITNTSNTSPTISPSNNNNPWSAVSEEVRTSMLSLLRTYVLPSLSLCGSNANIAFEAWEMIKSFHWSLRYELYTYLKDAGHEGHPTLLFARNRATAAARQTMKRVAVETLRQSGRMLGKLSHSNPFPVMEILVSTLERYDNLIPLSTEAMKYVGPLTLDVVAFTLVDRLWMDRPRSKGDGMTSADWLSSLAAFTGAFYRRYHQVEIGALLHRIICGLTGLGNDKDPLGSGDSSTHDQGSVDKLLAELPVLTLFRELITRMCGLEALPDVTEEQLNASGGSETLRNQFLSKNLVVGPAPWTAGTLVAKLAPKPAEAAEKIITLNSFKRALIRLRDTLLNGYGGGSVAIPLFILLAQQQDLVLFGVPTTPLSLPDNFDINNDDDVESIPLDFGAEVAKPPLKVVGSQYDSVHASLMLYADLLRVHAVPTLTTYKNMLPSLADLVGPYRLSPALAWLLARPVIRCASYPGIVDGLADINLSANPLLAANMGAAYLSLVNPTKATEDTVMEGTNDTKTTDNSNTNNAMEDGQITVEIPAAVTDEAVDKAIQSCLSNPWSIFCPDFHSTVLSLPIPSPKLWNNSLSSDLYIFFWSHTLYDISVPTNGYEKASTALREATAALDQLHLTDTRSVADRERVRTRYLETIKKLRSESPAQTAHVKRVIAGLTSIRERLFSSLPEKKAAIGALMQHCILPRALLSPEDALYCARFLLLLHEVSVPYFMTPSVLERVVTYVAPHLVASTEIEAACLGVLFAELFKTALRWRESVSVYNTEAGSKITFSSLYSDIHAKRLTHDEYIKIIDIIFDRMLKVSVTALSSTEYMETKNALVMLHRLGSIFPCTRTAAETILKQTSKLKDDASRSDIKAMTVAYHGMLEKKFIPPTPVVPALPPSSTARPLVSSTAGKPTTSTSASTSRPATSSTSTTSNVSRPSTSTSSTAPLRSSTGTTSSSSTSITRPSSSTSSSSARPVTSTSSSSTTSRPLTSSSSSASSSSSTTRPSTTSSTSRPASSISSSSSGNRPSTTSSTSGTVINRPSTGSTSGTSSSSRPGTSTISSSTARPGTTTTSSSTAARPGTSTAPSSSTTSRSTTGSTTTSSSSTTRPATSGTTSTTINRSGGTSTSGSSSSQRPSTTSMNTSSSTNGTRPLNDRDRDYRPSTSSTSSNIQSPRTGPTSSGTNTSISRPTSTTTSATTPTSKLSSNDKDSSRPSSSSSSTVTNNNNTRSSLSSSTNNSSSTSNLNNDRKRGRDDDNNYSSSSNSNRSNNSSSSLSSPSNTGGSNSNNSGGPVVIKRAREDEERSNPNRSESRGQSNNNSSNNNNNNYNNNRNYNRR